MTKRQPKGIETGGQFAPDVNPESTVDLPGVSEPMRHEAQIDTEIAAAYEKALRASNYFDLAAESVHYLLPNSERGYGRRGRGRVIDVEAIRTRWLAGEVGAKLDNEWARKDQAKTFARYDETLATFRAADDLYRTECKRYEGWSRFFLVPAGHVHSSLDCSTCNNGDEPTRFDWLPALSGLTEADAVADQGAILCTICFPSAPVEYTNKYDLDLADKLAKRCPGSGKYPVRDNQGRHSSRCPDCGEWVSITSTGKIRAHDKKTG
jgi:hypothetical protein